jgi:hypothetical protein
MFRTSTSSDIKLLKILEVFKSMEFTAIFQCVKSADLDELCVTWPFVVEIRDLRDLVIQWY